MKNELVAQACSVLQHVIAMMKWEMQPKYILYAQTGRKKKSNKSNYFSFRSYMKACDIQKNMRTYIEIAAVNEKCNFCFS